VSCPSRESCTAVGYSDKTVGGGRDTLAEHWGGTGWSIQPSPNPTAGKTSLRAVSCLSATSCTAVGVVRGRAPLAEHWDGTSWTIQPVPFPAGSPVALPYAVSCASPTSCTAVGFYYVGPSHKPRKGDDLPLVEHWDGSSWAVQDIPLPGGAHEGYLTGVACPMPASCVAVGYTSAAPVTFHSPNGGTEPNGPPRRCLPRPGWR
jgi:hypothetical protein